jgi:tetratricopeptide (TPR) repeat protein
LKFTDDAIAAYQQAIRLKPDDFSAWFGLANAYLQSDRTDDAIAADKQLIKLQPDCADAWKCLGLAYKLSGRNDDAQAAFQRARELNRGQK